MIKITIEVHLDSPTGDKSGLSGFSTELQLEVSKTIQKLIANRNPWWAGSPKFTLHKLETSETKV